MCFLFVSPEQMYLCCYRDLSLSVCLLHVNSLNIILLFFRLADFVLFAPFLKADLNMSWFAYVSCTYVQSNTNYPVHLLLTKFCSNFWTSLPWLCSFKFCCFYFPAHQNSSALFSRQQLNIKPNVVDQFLRLMWYFLCVYYSNWGANT